jgi:GR25 family glycosyltransferase involved in LPS biosynthesis
MNSPSWKIFVISLRRIRERRQQVIRQLLPLGLPFEIVDAVDAQQVKPECLVHRDDPPAMSTGAFGCYQSHLGVLERIVDYGLDYGIILEDDFILGDAQTLTFANLMDSIPPGADHVQLHMLKDFMCPEYEIEEEGEWFNKLHHTSLTTTGYLVSRKLAAHILEHHSIPRMPIDVLFIELSKSRTFDFYDVREKLIEHNWSLPSCINATGVETARPKVLCYTVALDLKEVKFYRQQARMMVASLKRCGFSGDIKIIHNGDTEIFDQPHPNVEEIGIETPATTALCYRVKFKARDLFSVEGYDWVMFLDSDFIIHANLDSWFTGPEIIRYATEPGFEIHYPQFGAFLTDHEMESLKRDGINSGAFVIKANHFHEVMALWQEIDAGETTRCKAGDQHAWNRLLLDTKLPTKLLANPDVKYFYNHAHVMEMLKAPVLHFCGIDAGERVMAMQAKFISHFHTDGDGTLVRLLER